MLKWWWLWQVFSLTQLHTPPTLSILLPHALIPGQFTLTTILVLFSPHAQVLGRFWSHAGFLPLPHELLSTHELQIHVLPVSGASTGKNGFVFPHAGPPLSVLFLTGSDCLPTHKHSSVWGAHSELRAVLLHPRLTVKGHLRFWLSHRFIWVVFPAVSYAHW